MQISNFRNLSFRTVLVLIILAISSAFYLFNLFTYKYQASSYISSSSLLALLPGCLLYWFARNIQKTHPHLSFILDAAWVIIYVSLVINFFTMTIQYTPFQLNDALLQSWDLKFGYNTVPVINWFFQFPKLIYILRMAYNSMIQEIFFVPIILALLQQRRRFEVFINVCLISAIIGYLIYYFFPTSDPAALFHSPHFSKNIVSVPKRFYDVQHYIVNHYIKGGIIGLPSFHVIWAIAVIYSFKNYKVLFYLFLIWNSVVILSTLALGWHFLVDILASFVIVAFAILLAEKKATEQDIALRTIAHHYKREWGPAS